jgi:hypothetical protein
MRIPPFPICIVFAISQLSPEPDVLIGYSVASIAGALAATVATCGPTAVLAYYASRFLVRASHIQAAPVAPSIGLIAASGLILALTSDRWLALLRPQRPCWPSRRGSIGSGCCWPACLGFCWRCLRKIATQFPGQAYRISKQTGEKPAFGGREIDE